MESISEQIKKEAEARYGTNPEFPHLSGVLASMAKDIFEAGASFRESLAGKGFRWSKHPDQNDSNLKEGDTLLFIRDNGSGEVVTFTHHAGYGLGVIDSHGEKAIVSVSRCTRIIIESPMKSEERRWSDSDVKKFLEDYRVANMDCCLNPVIWFDKLNDEK